MVYFSLVIIIVQQLISKFKCSMVHVENFEEHLCSDVEKIILISNEFDFL